MSINTQLFVKSTRSINIDKGFFAQLFKIRTFFTNQAKLDFKPKRSQIYPTVLARNIRRCNYRLSYIFLIFITHNIETHNLFDVNKRRRSSISYLIFMQFTIIPYLLNAFEVREK